jgi:hypothetical protein
MNRRDGWNGPRRAKNLGANRTGIKANQKGGQCQAADCETKKLSRFLA